MNAQVIQAANQFQRIVPRSDNETQEERDRLDEIEVRETYFLFCRIIEQKDNDSHLTPMKYMLRHLLIHNFGVNGAALDDEAVEYSFPGLDYAYRRIESCAETLFELGLEVEECEDDNGAFFAYPASLLLQEMTMCKLL